MNRFSASLLVSLLLNGCNYNTPSAFSPPVTEGPSGANQENFDARPAVRLPDRVAVVRIEVNHGGFRLIPETDVGQDLRRDGSRKSREGTGSVNGARFSGGPADGRSGGPAAGTGR